ncbi:ABC transporter permease [Fimbriiglobus ruber]|uniref:Permease subunit of a ABC-type transport system involved in lipoprotein release n=1 Tax=Fimbriiglobus ruber TaxID=1908690 RepID=A0A225E9M4_9BACT|nr:FtsX-like permease family protein [Fimbriiglobus ruber]OWK45127.1 Permease subunit of a ABC-type transport system involved in lipoprotein release [Fimbriiglobus ruber]
MRTTDLIGAAAGGLWRQKARTALTLAGVAVGGCAMAFSLSLGIGLRALIDREFQSRPGFWSVYVRASQRGLPVPEAEIPPEKIEVVGQMADDRRQRIRARRITEYQNERPRRPPVALTAERVAELRTLPDVVDVTTTHVWGGRVSLGDVRRDATVMASVPPAKAAAKRLIAGQVPAADDPAAAFVSEYLLYRLGVRDDAAVAAVIGKVIHIRVGGTNDAIPENFARSIGAIPDDLTAFQEQTLAKIAAQLPKAIDKLDLTATEKRALSSLFAPRVKPKAGTAAEKADAGVEGGFRIAGVYRLPTAEEGEGGMADPDAAAMNYPDLFIPPESGNRLFEQIPYVKQTGFQSATIRVRPGGDLVRVVAAAKAMGLQADSAAEWHKSAKREVTLIAAGLNLFSLVSLLIAALGITNTLITSVVERTREIGILKALGATDRQVMALFLTEGGIIGLTGGLLGLALAWGLSFPADSLVHRLIQEQAPEMLVSETVFEFPAWLPVLTVVFAILVTTLAAFYPSRRAARVQPVEALRHE